MTRATADGGDLDRREVDRHFAEAFDLTADDRCDYLQRLADSQPEIAVEVAALLELAGREDPRLDSGALADGPLWQSIAGDLTGMPAPAGFRSGDCIGAFRVLRELGRGGTAVVYLAERDDGLFEQRVAIKVVWSAVDAANTRERFEQERRILASLDHPSIARLLDAGFDARGFSYIVLEYVEGRPITSYCDQERAGIPERLAIFTQVCDAVLSAHRSLVVHRDLKPSNILVTETGTVKLLDFGIAKLLDAAAAGPSAAPPTRAFVRVLTPEYAAPEQLRGEPVTTATDVYQLGLILYELLAGVRAQRFEDDTPQGIARIVGERDPARPSVAALANLIRDESTSSPAARARHISGDLDAIVLKALRKEPRDRYQSPSQLAEDIERFRTGRPVLARNGTALYRGRKFIGRYRLAVAAIVATVALGIGYVWIVGAQGRRIAREAARTEQVSRLLVSLFHASDPGRSYGDQVTARELLDRGRERAERELTGQPELQAEMLSVLGEVYSTIGRYEEAIALLGRARDLRLRHEPGTERLARTTRWLGATLHFGGRYHDAEPVLREALLLHRRLLPAMHWEITNDLTALGYLLRTIGRLEEAERALREAVANERARPGALPAGRAEALRHLGNVLEDRGAWDEAERCYRDSAQILRESRGPRDPMLAASLAPLGRLLMLRGDLTRAQETLDEALSIRTSVYGDSHPTVGATLTDLGALRVLQHRPEEARDLLSRGRLLQARLLGEDHPLVASTLIEQAAAELQADNPRDALRRLDDAETRLARVGFLTHPLVADALTWRARSLLQDGNSGAAELAYRRALAIRESLSVPDDPRLVRLRVEMQGALAGGSAPAR